MKSAMGLRFKSKRETFYEHKDECKIPLMYTKRKDDPTFIKESPRLKKEAAEMRDFCRTYERGVKVSGVRQIYKQRPGSLPLYCRKPKKAVPLQDKESAPLLLWLKSNTKETSDKRKERTKETTSKEPPADRSTEVSIESTESSVVVVGHRVTQEGLEYLVKGVQEPDSAGV